MNKGKQVRCYHSSRILYNKPETNIGLSNLQRVEGAIKELFKDRIAPVKVFSDKILAFCSNILDLNERSKFIAEWGDKGGVYIIQYKHDPLVYYIGRTSKFSNRFRAHIKQKGKDKFHVFADMVGWEQFIVGIVEICDKDKQGIRENFYLQKYLPLLNSTFQSKHSESAIYQTLSNILLSKKSLNEQTGINQGVPVTIWVYKICTTHIEKTFTICDSINKASKVTGSSRETIQRYLNTNVPIKGFLYYSRPIKDFDGVLNLTKSSLDELNIDGNIPKKVWIYTIKDGSVVPGTEQPFPSREQTAKFFNVSYKIIKYYIDSWKPQSLKGYYLFSTPLDNSQLNSLLELSKEKPLAPKKLVWVYSAKTL